VIVGAAEVDEATLAEWQVRCTALAEDRNVYWGLVSERASFSQFLELLCRGKVDIGEEWGLGGQATAMKWLPPAVIRKNQIRASQMSTRLIDAVDDPQRLIAAAKRNDQEVIQLARSLSVRYLPLRTLFPSLSRACELDAATNARLHCTAAGLAAERYRLATGAFPESLADLVPAYLEAVPIDPFTGKPLHFKQIEDGILIYSVNDDGKDDGGVLFPEVDREPHDIGFRVFKPEARGYPIIDDEGAGEDQVGEVAADAQPPREAEDE
jgi:hypothetical protein